jgi:hypothetical protein
MPSARVSQLLLSLLAAQALLTGCAGSLAGMAAGSRLLQDAGLEWQGRPKRLMAERMTYAQALERLGQGIMPADWVPPDTPVWLAAFSGRYVWVPRDPKYDVLGPYEGCVYIIFDAREKLLGVGGDCPGPARTPTPSPVLSATPGPILIQTPRPSFGAAQAPDFAFRYESSGCVDRVLDTMEGTFTSLVEIDPPRSVTLPVRFSDEEMEAVYDKLVEIDFWSYPATFDVPQSPSGYKVSTAIRVRILVRNAGVERSVNWAIQYLDPGNREADQLTQLVALFDKLIRSVPDFPEPNFGCL